MDIAGVYERVFGAPYGGGAIPEAGKNWLDIKIPFDGVASEQASTRRATVWTICLHCCASAGKFDAR